MINIAHVYTTQGKYSDSLYWYKKAYETRKQSLGPDHPDTLLCMNSIGLTYKHMTEYDKARGVLLECRALREKALGPEHVNVLVTMDALGDVYLLCKQYKEAEGVFKECMRIRTKVLGEGDLMTLFSVNNLADAYLAEGNCVMAHPLYSTVYNGRKIKLGSQHPEAVEALEKLDRCLAIQKSRGNLAAHHKSVEAVAPITESPSQTSTGSALTSPRNGQNYDPISPASSEKVERGSLGNMLGFKSRSFRTP